MASTKYDAVEEMKSAIGLEDLMQVLSYYNIEVRRKRILCPFPEHNDHHIGNCAISDRGYVHCYACGQNADAIKLVSIKEGLGFMEAIEFLWTNILGRTLPEAFHQKQKKKVQLNLHDLRFLGLESACGKYVPCYVNDVWTEKDGVPDGLYVDYRQKEADGCCPVYGKRKTPSLYDLLDEDPATAKWLLTGKCMETLRFYESYLAELKSPGTDLGKCAADDPDFMAESERFLSAQISRAKKLGARIKSLR